MVSGKQVREDIMESRQSTPSRGGAAEAARLLQQSITFQIIPQDIADEETQYMRPLPSVDPADWKHTVETDELLVDCTKRWTNAVEYEFWYRDQVLKQEDGWKIHHFNWEGRAIEAPSNTPPEVSLFVMMSWPRVHKRERDKIKLNVLMKNAMKWVDPVVVALERSSNIPRVPSKLLKYGEGITQKYYTEHGSWCENESEVEHGVILDDGDVEGYADPRWAIGSGFIEGTPVDSRKKWCLNIKTAEHDARKEAKRRCKLKKKKVRMQEPNRPSRLRACVNIDEIDDPIIKDYQGDVVMEDIFLFEE